MLNKFNNTNKVKKEISKILEYAEKMNCEIKNIPKRLNTLNYFVTGDMYFEYKRRHSKESEIIDMYLFNGICIPYVNNNNVIDDIVVIVSKENKNNPQCVIHELLHFLSTNLNAKNEIICGIDNFEAPTFIRRGMVAINEGLTDYFAYKICGNYYDPKYFKFRYTKEDEKTYYYSTLLINLIAYEDLEMESKLFNAYINNDIEYIYSSLEKAFGINRNKLLNIFNSGEEYAVDKSDVTGYKNYLEDIKEIIKYYYDNVYSKKQKDLDFVENYLKLFI